MLSVKVQDLSFAADVEDEDQSDGGMLFFLVIAIVAACVLYFNPQLVRAKSVSFRAISHTMRAVDGH